MIRRVLELLIPLLVISAVPAQPAPDPAGDWSHMRDITPRCYAIGRTATPIKIDGTGDDPAWAAAPWTEDFADIQGDRRPSPRFRTRAKMLWDDKYLYIHAELEEPHVWATITKKNEVIFQDNDFEVFINPNADNHHYYEYEMNALNTIWELTLDKPYRDGGPVHLGTNIDGLKSAVHVDGTINNPSDTDRSWSVDIAIPFAGLATYADAVSCPPKVGDQWRLNFSRVEWLADIIDGKYRKIPKEMRDEDNWVWSPQGVVDMHRPERWGFVQFCDDAKKTTVKPDPTLPVRDRLMEIYYRERHFHGETGRYTGHLRELGLADADLPAGINMSLSSTGDDFTAAWGWRDADGGRREMQVMQDSHLVEVRKN
jgi:hypothetical protein